MGGHTLTDPEEAILFGQAIKSSGSNQEQSGSTLTDPEEAILFGHAELACERLRRRDDRRVLDTVRVGVIPADPLVRYERDRVHRRKVERQLPRVQEDQRARCPRWGSSNNQRVPRCPGLLRVRSVRRLHLRASSCRTSWPNSRSCATDITTSGKRRVTIDVSPVTASRTRCSRAARYSRPCWS